MECKKIKLPKIESVVVLNIPFWESDLDLDSQDKMQ